MTTGGHDPKERGFTVQNIETTFEGKVDPYFRGQAALVHQIDTGGESFVELEEAYLESMSLPANLQLRGGRFFTEFGRQNQFHPHAWDFVDQPLVMGRFLGDDGLRSAGARLSWLTPTPFYSELYLTVQNSQGPTVHSFRNDNGGELFFGRPSSQGSVKGLGDMLFVPRYVASFNLSDSQTVVAGASGAFGWLARSILGEYRAVKVVYRRHFEDDRPFEREFEGIKKFEPISRTHESLRP